MNRLVMILATSPLHWLLGPYTHVLRYTGPRSGRSVQLPLWAVRTSDEWLVVVGEHERKTWWRAFRQPLAATLVSGGQSRQLVGQLLGGPERDAALTAYLRKVPMARRSTSAQSPVLRLRVEPTPPR
ncbi:MAG: hypothetical protein ACOYBY_05450 [Dermatophilaceae bacterium]